MIALVPVLDRYARSLWPQIEAWVASATKDTGNWWQPDDVLAGIERGNLTAWVSADEHRLWGVVVAEVENAARHRIGVIALCAGDELSRWLHLLPEVEGWARDHGCTEMMIKGRSGWARRLRSHGYGDRFVTIGKDISQ